MHGATEINVNLLVRLTAVLFFALIVLIPTVRVLGDDLFFARMPTSYVFPECGNPNEFQCSYDLAVSIYSFEYDADLVSKRDEYLKILPDKLLNAVIFTTSTAIETCSRHVLFSELTVARKNSAAYDGFYANGLSLEATRCFAGGLVTNEFDRELILLWQSGSVQAWIECKGRACNFNLVVDDSDQDLPGNSINLSIRSIAADAAQSFIRNMKSVVRRVALYSKDYYPKFELYNGNIAVLAMDENARSIIDSWGTR